MKRSDFIPGSPVCAVNTRWTMRSRSPPEDGPSFLTNIWPLDGSHQLERMAQGSARVWLFVLYMDLLQNAEDQASLVTVHAPGTAECTLHICSKLPAAAATASNSLCNNRRGFHRKENSAKFRSPRFWSQLCHSSFE